MGQNVYEVLAAGFDSGSDETDDCVFWVLADSEAQVNAAIQDTGARFGGQVPSCHQDDVDFVLPRQSIGLSEALLEKASELRSKNRPVG